MVAHAYLFADAPTQVCASESLLMSSRNACSLMWFSCASDARSSWSAALQAIEEAIQRGLPRVEAGAQGEHKIQRGYLPSLTHSVHYIRDPEFRFAVQQVCARGVAQGSELACRSATALLGCLLSAKATLHGSPLTGHVSRVACCTAHHLPANLVLSFCLSWCSSCGERMPTSTTL